MAPTTQPPAGPGPDPAGPFYGPVDRYGRPRVDLHDGPPPAPPVPQPTQGARSSGASVGWPPPTPADWPPPASWHPAGPAWPPGPAPAPYRQDYASWGRRVVAGAIDAVPAWIASAVLVAGYLPIYLGFFRGDLRVMPDVTLVAVGLLLSLAATGLMVYNRYVLAGRTGQSFGKRVMKLWLVRRSTGRPIGVLDAFVRDLLHVLDRLGLVGYLWPLWDDERQTLADKVAQTVVVRTPVPPLTPFDRTSG